MHRAALLGLIWSLLSASTQAEVVTTGTVEAASTCLPDALNKWAFTIDPAGQFESYMSSRFTAPYTDLKYGLPTDRCSFVEMLPKTARQDYFTYESRVSQYWNARKSNFSEWSSTCTGTLYASGQSLSEAVKTQVTPFLEPTAQARLNSFTVGPVTCSSTTIAPSTGGVHRPEKTMAGGAALAAAAAYALFV